MADFFARNIITVYFFYGLSFFSMGLAILVELGHASESDFARALRPLAGFGLVHGSHEWLEMFLIIHDHVLNEPPYGWVFPVRIVLLAVSFMFLVWFGARLIAGPTRKPQMFTIIGLLAIIWLLGLWMVYRSQSSSDFQVASDVYTRYSLAVPGAALTAWGLLIQRQRFIKAGMSGFGRDVALAALSFGLYGGVGQIFASPSNLFPSTYLNATVFTNWFGVPIQVFRALMACMTAVFIIRSLRSFEVDTQRQIENLRTAQQEERQRLENLRNELLHRTVKAQESERQRIARDLHDGTGQVLTALGMGLRGLSENIRANPGRAWQQAMQLESLALSGVDELQHMVRGLHPPQLDDFGLLAALRWYAGDVSQQYEQIDVKIVNEGQEIELPTEIRTELFRIAQEATTNAVRHSGAKNITIYLSSKPDSILLKIQDDGRGFDVEQTLRNETERPCWGLIGMIERATLIGGTCTISSEPGVGTGVKASLVLEEIKG